MPAAMDPVVFLGVKALLLQPVSAKKKYCTGRRPVNVKRPLLSAVFIATALAFLSMSSWLVYKVTVAPDMILFSASLTDTVSVVSCTVVFLQEIVNNRMKKIIALRIV